MLLRSYTTSVHTSHAYTNVFTINTITALKLAATKLLNGEHKARHFLSV